MGGTFHDLVHCVTRLPPKQLSVLSELAAVWRRSIFTIRQHLLCLYMYMLNKPQSTGHQGAKAKTAKAITVSFAGLQATVTTFFTAGSRPTKPTFGPKARILRIHSMENIMVKAMLRYARVSTYTLYVSVRLSESYCTKKQTEKTGVNAWNV